MGICFGCVAPLRQGAVRDLRNGVAKELDYPDYFALQVAGERFGRGDTLRAQREFGLNVSPREEENRGRSVSLPTTRKMNVLSPIGSGPTRHRQENTDGANG